MLRGTGDVATRVLGLGRGDSERFDSGERIDGVDEGKPETALSGISRRDPPGW